MMAISFQQYTIHSRQSINLFEVHKISAAEEDTAPFSQCPLSVAHPGEMLPPSATVVFEMAC